VSLLRFEIRYADGRKELAAVDGERALIGNGAHCDIRLPLDQAAYEHLAVEVVGGTVRVESKAIDPPATVNGMPFTNIPMTPDVPLKIGSTRILIALGEGAFEGAPTVQKKSEKTSPLMKVLGVLALAGGAWMLLTTPESEEIQAPAQMPDLFMPRPTSCPQSAQDQARSFAQDKFDIAEGKRERSPFVPKEGVLAVNLYEMASVCFKRAGAQAQAADADLAATQLRTAITQDFRSRRVRLEHLMKVEDYELARKDVTVLRSLTQGQHGQYVGWLAQANQIIKQKAPPK
jgi:hypothetical protein